MAQPTSICPYCGEKAVTFRRERVGTNRTSYKDEQGNTRYRSAMMYKTIGFCSACGKDWEACSNDDNNGKNQLKQIEKEKREERIRGYISTAIISIVLIGFAVPFFSALLYPFFKR